MPPTPLAPRALRAAPAALAAVAAALLASCGPVGDPRASAGFDLRPPGVEAVSATGPRELRLRFDEEAEVEPSLVRVEPALEVVGVSPRGTEVAVTVSTQSPGREYRMEATARDARGNATTFLAAFRGYNPRVPRVLVNELIPRGSGAHPDLVELKVLSGGNLGGVTFLAGTPSDYDARLVFPALEVAAGAFVLVHCHPAGDPSELDETSDPSACAAADAVAGAWDFWLAGGEGLGANNGVITVYDRPGGVLLDGLLYSNRTSGSDEEWRGFGSASMLARAEELVRDGGWRCAGAAAAPEDAVNPDGSTATRSLCRSSGSADTDCRADWHIVPTRTSSFGAENSDEVYVP